MKITREITQQASNKMLITFHDVAAGFSEEEWKLLHEWQKELYTTVMKEIHQAMTSLGPLIATSVFSLGAKGKEDLCAIVHQDSETRQPSDTSHTAADYEVTFGINVEDNLYAADSQETERMPQNDRLNTGYPNMNVGNVLRMEPGSEAISMDLQSAEEEESTGLNLEFMDATPVASFNIKEEAAMYSKNHQLSEAKSFFSTPRDAENNSREHLIGDGRENNTILSSAAAPPVIAPVPSFSIKEDGSTFFMENLNAEMGGNVYSPMGGDQRSRTKTDDDSFITERTACTSHGNNKYNMLQSSNKITKYRWQWWSQQSQEPKGEKITQIESDFSDATHSNLHDKDSTLEESQKDNVSNIDFSSSGLLNYQANTKQKWNLCTSAEYEKRLRQTKSPFKYRRTSHCMYGKHLNKFAGMNPKNDASMYQCTFCGKRFNHKGHFTTHIRTHTKERPFPCNVCEKSFSTKGNLIIHKRLHTGERPYHCTACKKSFCQQGHLTKHYRSQHMAQNT